MTSQLIDFVHDERLDQAETLKLVVPAAASKAYLLEPDNELAWRDRRFIITEEEAERDENETTVTVEAEATWYAIGNVTHVGSLVLTDVTPAAGLATILENTGWTVGAGTTSTTDTFTLEAEDKSRLELLRTWAKITGRFVVFDSPANQVNLVDERGADLGLGFRYRRNLRRTRRRIKPPLVTVLYAYGADNLSIAGANGGVPFIEDFSYYTDKGIDLDAVRPDGRTNREHYTRSVVWSDTAFVEDTALLAAAVARLEELSQPIISYELDVVDLTELTSIAELVRVGDTVRVEDPQFADDVRTTVVRVQRYPYEPHRNRIELAYLPRLIDDGSSSLGRSSSAAQWLMFQGPITADFEIRNNGIYTVARIPLRFSSGGKMHLHLDLRGVGVGAGTVTVSVYDDETDTTVDTQTATYSDGQPWRIWKTWSADELEGRLDYRLRVTTTADGGPSPTNGVNLAEETVAKASWYVLAQGAVRETPVAPNSVTYNYTGANQTFIVPDGIHEIEVTAKGASGGDFNGQGGNGAEVTAKFGVIPGTVYTVVVGGSPSGGSSTAGWPNGGQGGSSIASSVGAGGGGATWLVASGGAITSALIVAGAGGGAGLIVAGGAGGFHNGSPGVNGQSGGGQGASQFAGGAAGTSGGGSVGEAGDVDGVGFGGDGANGGGSLGYGGGGGGGGWHGGGGAGSTGSFGGDAGGGGGGGSSFLVPSAYELAYSDGSNNGHGQVVVSWETPS